MFSLARSISARIRGNRASSSSDVKDEKTTKNELVAHPILDRLSEVSGLTSLQSFTGHALSFLSVTSTILTTTNVDEVANDHQSHLPLSNSVVPKADGSRLSLSSSDLDKDAPIPPLTAKTRSRPNLAVSASLARWQTEDDCLLESEGQNFLQKNSEECDFTFGQPASPVQHKSQIKDDEAHSALLVSPGELTDSGNISNLSTSEQHTFKPTTKAAFENSFSPATPPQAHEVYTAEHSIFCAEIRTSSSSGADGSSNNGSPVHAVKEIFSQNTNSGESSPMTPNSKEIANKVAAETVSSESWNVYLSPSAENKSALSLELKENDNGADVSYALPFEDPTIIEPVSVPSAILVTNDPNEADQCDKGTITLSQNVVLLIVPEADGALVSLKVAIPAQGNSVMGNVKDCECMDVGAVRVSNDFTAQDNFKVQESETAIAEQEIEHLEISNEHVIESNGLLDIKHQQTDATSILSGDCMLAGAESTNSLAPKQLNPTQMSPSNEICHKPAHEEISHLAKVLMAHGMEAPEVIINSGCLIEEYSSKSPRSQSCPNVPLPSQFYQQNDSGTSVEPMSVEKLASETTQMLGEEPFPIAAQESVEETSAIVPQVSEKKPSPAETQVSKEVSLPVSVVMQSSPVMLISETKEATEVPYEGSPLCQASDPKLQYLSPLYDLSLSATPNSLHSLPSSPTAFRVSSPSAFMKNCTVDAPVTARTLGRSRSGVEGVTYAKYGGIDILDVALHTSYEKNERPASAPSSGTSYVAGALDSEESLGYGAVPGAAETDDEEVLVKSASKAEPESLATLEALEAEEVIVVKSVPLVSVFEKQKQGEPCSSAFGNQAHVAQSSQEVQVPVAVAKQPVLLPSTPPSSSLSSTEESLLMPQLADVSPETSQLRKTISAGGKGSLRIETIPEGAELESAMPSLGRSLTHTVSTLESVASDAVILVVDYPAQAGEDVKKGAHQTTAETSEPTKIIRSVDGTCSKDIAIAAPEVSPTFSKAGPAPTQTGKPKREKSFATSLVSCFLCRVE